MKLSEKPLRSITRYEGVVIDVRLDLAELPDGNTALREAVEPIGRFAAGYGLTLHPGKVRLTRADRRVTFLGMEVEPWRRRRLSRVLAKGRRVCREWDERAATAWQLPPLEQLTVLQTAGNVRGSYSGLR